ncbi:hypothetical protein [Nocardia araoensis]|uniref:hypothetical protein n=1 Tax=Nocardia araoensis TaxID=228600 RepID=UPI0002EC644D|nr:hypothetical protein [Nocardia araoensis]
MSTESERRPYGDGTEQNSAAAGQRGAEPRYAGAGETDRAQQAGPVGEPAATQRDPGQVPASGGIDDAQRAQTTGAAHEAHGSEPASETSARQDAIGAPGATESAAAPNAPTAGTADAQPAPLLPEGDLDRLRTKWREVQVTFVDNPRDAVARADELLGDTIHQLTTTYDQRKRELDERLGDTSDTEGLRQALRGYRAFFDQLLSIGG